MLWCVPYVSTVSVVYLWCVPTYKNCTWEFQFSRQILCYSLSPPLVEHSDSSRILLIPICIISNYALAYLNTCLLKQKLYGAATIADQDTIRTAPWVPNDVWDTTIFCQVSNWNNIGLREHNYLNNNHVSIPVSEYCHISK